MSRQIVTVAVPPSLAVAAGHVHVLLSKTSSLDTYASPAWRDAQGNLYAVSSGTWSDVQLAGVLDPSAFGGVVEQIRAAHPGLDLGLVAEAQAAFVIGDPSEPETCLAAPDRIVAIVGLPGLEALALMGIERVEAEDDAVIVDDHA